MKWLIAGTTAAILIGLLVAVGSTSESPRKVATPAPTHQPPPTSSIVQFQSPQAKQQFEQRNNLSANDLKPVPDTSSYVVPKQLAQVKSSPGTTTQPNYVYHAMLTPDDPLYPQWYTDRISAPIAWNVTTGSSTVTVAVLDTGFALSHQDMVGRWATDGWNFILNDNNPSAGQTDPTSVYASHGTITSGLIGATGNNGIGVASLNWGSTILPIEVLSDDGVGTTATVVSGINYAVAHGANIISMSLGQTTDDPTLHTAVDNAIAAGVTVVAAAGNCGGSDWSAIGCDYQGEMVYPGNYPEVISVGATDINDNRASFSSYGPNLTVMAPGYASGVGSDVIESPFWTPSNQTSLYTTGVAGTSIATPIVAGLASLLKSEAPSATPVQIKQWIEGGADKVAGMDGQTRTDQYGYGRINAAASFNQYAITSQAAYTDSSKTTPVDLTQLSPGQTAWLELTVTNTGASTWSNSGSNPIDLGTDYSRDRLSRYCVTSGATPWLGCNRPARLEQASVAPGATGTFEFPIQVPAGAGTFNEYFTPVEEGVAWMNQTGLNYHTVVNQNYSWSLTSQAAYTDSTKSTPVDLTKLSPGQKVYLGLTIQNTGTNTWYTGGPYPVHLGADEARDRSSPFCDAATWLGCNRPAGMQNASNSSLTSVTPGESADFYFWYDAPAAGVYSEHFAPVVEGVTWMNDIGLNYYTVVDGGYSWEMVSQAAYSDAAMTTPANLTQLSPGEITYWQVKAKNMGTATWYNSGPYPVDLGTSHAQDRMSLFCDQADTPTWLGCNRPARLTEASVAPGATGTFSFSTKAPASGTYLEYLDPVTEGITWMNDVGMNFYTIVH